MSEDEEGEEEEEEDIEIIMEREAADKDKTIASLLSKLSIYEHKMKDMKQEMSDMKKEQIR